MAPIILVSDLDHTMVQNEDKSSKRQLAFNHLWTTHCAKHDNLLVWSTGRSPTLFKALWQEAPLLTPDVLICSVGTEIFYNVKSRVAELLLGEPTSSDSSKDSTGSCWARFLPDPKWEAVLDEGWSRQKVQEVVRTCCPQLQPQSETEQRPHKLSYILPASARSKLGTGEDEPVIKALRGALEHEGLTAKVVYSGGQDVDVLSSGAGKGCALAFLMKRLREVNYPLEHVQVNGDSGNDAELLDVEGVVGCVVANAHPELRRYAQNKDKEGAKNVLQAKNPCAGGIIEAMLHFGLLHSNCSILSEYAGLLDLPGIHPHGPSQLPHPSTIPTTAEPSPPGGTAITAHCDVPAANDGDDVSAAADVGEGGGAQRSGSSHPEIEAAARAVGRDWKDCIEAGPGDVALQHTGSGLQVQATPLTVMHAGAKASHTQGGKNETESEVCELGREEGVREWVWRLGRALAQQLVAVSENWSQLESEGKLPPHSPLRLFVTNSCQLHCTPTSAGVADAAKQGSQPGKLVVDVLEAPKKPTKTVSAGMLGAAALEGEEEGAVGRNEEVPPEEVRDDLQPTGAADAAARDANSIQSRAWVDQVQITFQTDSTQPTSSSAQAQQQQAGSTQSGAVAHEPAGSGDDEPLYKFTASFKVCMLESAEGRRSTKHIWSIQVEGLCPKEPVPHGYLASTIHVDGPLEAAQQALDLPHCA